MKHINLLLLFLGLFLSTNSYANKNLWKAVKTKRISDVKSVLATKPNLNSRGKHFQTALHFAAENNLTSIAIALLEAGANPDLIDITRSSALHYAASNKNQKLLIKLIQCSHNLVSLINKKNLRGLTASKITRRNFSADSLGYILKNPSKYLIKEAKSHEEELCLSEQAHEEEFTLSEPAKKLIENIATTVVKDESLDDFSSTEDEDEDEYYVNNETLGAKQLIDTIIKCIDKVDLENLLEEEEEEEN